MTSSILLSHLQAKVLLDIRRSHRTSAQVSLDLNRTTSQVILRPDDVLFPNDETLSWRDVEKVFKSKSNCFFVQERELRKIHSFSEDSDLSYSLMPTNGAPTILLSGIPMHRIKGTDPHRDTLEKIKALQPITGDVLDTATGLGYTAIEAARTAEHVLTCEIDPAVLEIARLNPWSQELFDNPRITQITGDIFDAIANYDRGTFHRILHDPPMFSLAGHLYSSEFYRELFRVLRPTGLLFHYVGNPQSRSGRNMTNGVIQRLREAGFQVVRRYPAAFGVVASK
jgi:predicted methyltransferase